MCSVLILTSIYCVIMQTAIRYLAHKDLDHILKIPLDYDHFEKPDDAPA